ncbi:E3 ubiquitin-protein ligase DTX3L-like isoform X2 [Colossoma macropomum]|uniref:E3 ubiquitin-protein ligase DTX3L-like isoform X2 n=1 Tax=Colossoma macropomum TaxID=42526 RepID=UPI0018640053|nr:E3 ubiquitin-protein ligase DTX3L-like isoform X2 [Colossoma macropomum]
MSSVDPPEEEKMDIDEDTQTPRVYPDLTLIQRQYAQQTPPHGADGSHLLYNSYSPRDQKTGLGDMNMDDHKNPGTGDPQNTHGGGNDQNMNAGPPASNAIITQPGKVQGDFRSRPEAFGLTNTQVLSSGFPDTAVAQMNPQQEPHKSTDAQAVDEDLHTADAAGAKIDDGDKNASGDAGTTIGVGSKPSAPLDSAKVNIKVEWTEKFPEKWKKHLQIALQSWFNKLFEQMKETCTVLNLQLLADQHQAMVEISPSKALDILRTLKIGSLTFKELKCSTIVHFLVDETKSLKEPPKSIPTVEEEKVPVPELDMFFTAFMDLDKCPPNIQTELKRRFGNPQFGKNLSFSGPFHIIEKNYREFCGIIRASETGMAAAAAVKNDLSRAEIPQHAEKSGGPPAFTIPLFQYWYLSHAFRNELSQFEKEFGVKINADVSVSVTAVDQTRRDSVQEAAQRFIDFYQQSTQNLQCVNIPQTQLESEIVKEAVHNIQSDQTKMMLNMSADQCLLFGPKPVISAVQKRMDLESGMKLAESYSNGMTSKMETDISDASRSWSSQMSRTLEMDIRDTPDSIEMNKTHWELMKKIFKKQIHDIEKKYGVVFNAVPSQGSIKVTVHSVNQGVNLESHALRAFMHLYQKVATSAVACTFKNPAEAKTVDQALERLGCQDCFVGVQEKNDIWKLVGLPKHLGPAITDIEKLVGKRLFDDKTKRLVGYSGNFPQSWGLRGGQQGAGAVGWTDGPSPNIGAQANNEPGKAANKKESDKSKDDDCPICMDKFTDKTKLKCGHEFCKGCLQESVKSMGKICPVCKDIFGMLMGTQPDGTMDVSTKGFSLSGYPRCGTIEIIYTISDGIQTERHPNPGQRFYGTSRRAYLPDNDEGRHVLKLLRKAFDQKLIFTVGTSTTTGAQNVVIWNDIHHKTNTSGGQQSYGYPDPDYLKRVREELKAKGIE